MVSMATLAECRVEEGHAVIETQFAPDACPPVPGGTGSAEAFTGTLVFSGFGELVRELGGRADPLLEQCGLDPRTFSKADGRVSQKRAGQLLEIAAVQLGCPDFGLRLGARQSMPNVMRPLLGLFYNAPTLRDSFGACIRHMGAYNSGVVMHFDDDFADERSLLHLHFVDHTAIFPQLMEMLVLLTNESSTFLTDGFGRSREIHFSHSPVSRPATYARHFDSVVRFSQGFDGIVFGHADLAARVSDEGDERFAREEQRISGKFPVNECGLALETRLAVLGLLTANEHCTRLNVAHRLGMQERTLNRRLAKENTSFEAVRDEARCRLAYRYLSRTDLSLTEITGKLGYSEVAVLSRSCRRWFGAPPRRLRQSFSKNFGARNGTSPHNALQA